MENIKNYDEILSMWRGWCVRTAADIDRRLYHFRILFAYHSGKIENRDITYHDTHEIFENGRVLNFTGDPRSIFEIENQKLCYAFLKHKIAAREPINIPLMLEIHAILTSGTYDETRYIDRGERPGSFKKHDYVTGRAEVGSLPLHVPRDMESLLNEITIQGGSKDNALTAAAYFHAMFEYIHPFADGNGRVGRVCLNYFLMAHDHPPLIIFDEDKPDYYAALEAFDQTEDLMPMLNFLRRETERTWAKTLLRESSRIYRNKAGEDLSI